MLKIIIAALCLASAAHAAPASLSCKQRPGRHRTIVDSLTLSLLPEPADPLLGPDYRVFSLSGHLASLADSPTTEYQDEQGNKVVANTDYEIEPLKFDCLIAGANQYLLRCDNHDTAPLVLRNSAGVEFRFRVFAGDIHNELTVREHRDLEVNPKIIERVTRNFDFKLPMQFFTGQYAAISRSVAFDASECQSQ